MPKKFQKTSLLLALLVALVLGGIGYFVRDRFFPHEDAALGVVRSYLSAVYARDFKDAYHYLSSTDRDVTNEADYIRSQGSYSGFALEVARKLTSFMELWLIERSTTNDRVQIKVGYRIPAPADLSGLLLNWDQDKLNALSQDRQKQILAELDARKKDGKLLTIEGQETFELTQEGNAWRVFLDWASGTKVKLRAQLPKSGEIEVRFAQTELIVKDNELFLVNLVVKNRSSRTVTFTVNHNVDPGPVADYLELIECGLLVPITIEPGQEQEFSMAYLFDTAGRQNYREFNLAYEFSVK